MALLGEVAMVAAYVAGAGRSVSGSVARRFRRQLRESADAGCGMVGEPFERRATAGSSRRSGWDARRFSRQRLAHSAMSVGR
ncbi:MAG: hypothetical protein R2695_22340 [Acidimicrobiales bacterium]